MFKKMDKKKAKDSVKKLKKALGGKKKVSARKKY